MTKPPLPKNDMYTGHSDQVEFGDTPSHAEYGEKPTANYDPVFGEIREGGPNYRSVRTNTYLLFL
ncbi:hypothetical protein IMZ48_06025 [Candidatus Bathyarchaeota archaeon]|nr:hypothetical protein [Candidatus Bathyarchaeota archaeon]